MRLKLDLCVELRKRIVGRVAQLLKTNHLCYCATTHTVVRMTSAYEGGAVPQIEVRHRLRIAREFADLEQEELAARMSVGRSTISNAENGKGEPRRTTIRAWALACGVPVQWIMTGENPPGPTGGAGAPATPIPGSESPLPGSNRGPLAYLVLTQPAPMRKAA